MSVTRPEDGLLVGRDGSVRCWWQKDLDDYRAYHDNEWGRPVADDVRLFEKICLEGFQSGLSWLTILRKRENFRRAFSGFNPSSVAEFDAADIERLLLDAGIVRHRQKIVSTINNARRAIELADEFGSLAAYFWRHEPKACDRPSRFDAETLRGIAKTPGSIALSADLKQRGWTFVGPTTVYAFMQAMGLVNDHVEGCVIRDAATSDRLRFTVPE